MNNEDKQLGMNRDISRRDFLDGSLKFATGLALAGAMPSARAASNIGMAGTHTVSSGYPPARPNLRGSHLGSFEVAHQLAWEGKTDWGQVNNEDTTEYDLIVVGAGVSGLAAAYFYREQHPDARILILENHDDFGGHAKRNEFAWGDRTILGYGGSQSLEAPSAYSDVSKSLLQKLSLDVDQLADSFDRDFYRRHNLSPVVYFDKETYGSDVTLSTFFGDVSAFLEMAEPALDPVDAISQMPISEEAKGQLKQLLGSSDDALPDHSILAEPEFLGTISYEQFLTKHLEITNPEVLGLLRDMGNSYFGYGMDLIPALSAFGMGAPGLSRTSLGTIESLLRLVARFTTEPYIFHFPDGNASVPRLLVRQMIPEVASGSTMFDVVTSTFDYSKLDSAESNVRMRLNSTVINVAHDGEPGSAKQVNVTYVRDGKASRVTGKKVVLACYNMAIPHLCPEMPAKQKEALSKLVKIPMCSNNVLLNNWHAVNKLGIGYAYSPGRWNSTLLVDFPVSMGDYQFATSPDDPIVLTSLKGVSGPGDTPEEQSRSGRYELLAMSFEDYERELRKHLAGMLGSAGFDPARDIAAITVNRWPHGYAWDANPLTSPEYPPGGTPYEVGRKPFHRIAIANSDSGGRAYLDCAIDEAYRAVGELV